MIKIVIAHPQRLFREALGQMMASGEGIEIAALCKNSDEAVDSIQRCGPDLIFIDMKLHPLSGVTTIQKIRQRSDVKIIGLSMSSLPSLATQSFSAGANGFISKNSRKEEIFTAIDAIAKGKKYICNEVKDLIVMQQMEPAEHRRHAGSLTDREIRVAQLVSQGYSTRDIAIALDCSAKTIEVHRHHMLKKLQLKNTSELVNYLYAQLPEIFLPSTFA